MELNELFEEIVKKFHTKEAEVKSQQKSIADLTYERNQLKQQVGKIEQELTALQVKWKKVTDVLGDAK